MSFSSPSSRYSNRTELPLRGPEEDDMFEKPERRSGMYSPPSYANGYRKPAWSTAGSKSGYLKVGGAVAMILLVLYVLMSGETARGKLEKGEASVTNPKEAAAAALGTTSKAKCTKPHDPSKPLIQYALMVDAGSTGSRIHAYRFNNCGPTPELEDEMFEQTAKKKGGSGLSSYDADAEGAAKSLDVLLDAALRTVPKQYRSCSPIAVKATAGLRKLGTEKSEKILEAVRHRLETKYPFPVLSDEKGGVEVMDGRDEGVYAWITTNYLLGNIGGPEKKPSAAVFDLGGGSTQVVFEPTAPEGNKLTVMPDGDHVYKLNFGKRSFVLYQHSYLGYGLMAARENLHSLVFSNAEKENGGSGWKPSRPITNPCIQPDQSAAVNVTFPTSHPLSPQIEVEMKGLDRPSSKDCFALAESTLHKEKECALAPCAFEGQYQPRLSDVFANEEIYLFSYFYDRLSELGMPSDFSLSQLQDVADAVCAGEASGSWKIFPSEAVDELHDRAEGCLDLSFQLALLTRGYEMEPSRRVKIAKKIDGRELGWCLGASLPLLETGNGWSCKVQDVTP